MQNGGSGARTKAQTPVRAGGGDGGEWWWWKGGWNMRRQGLWAVMAAVEQTRRDMAGEEGEVPDRVVSHNASL